MGKRLAAAATVLLGTTVLAGADPVPRETPLAGSVIARKSGEEARFIEIGSWQVVDISQDLRPGDVLRTNAGGNLAILFSDRTQVRLGRNSTLVVTSIGGTGEDTQLALESGQLWARAERGGDGVTVATPAATAAIRGTDWSMQVNGDQTSLNVLEGEVNLFNPQGSVALKAGEGASARIGQAPARLVDVNPNDREQILYYYSLRNAFTFLPASDLLPRDLRAERARINAIREDVRNATDRVTLAEAALSLDGQEAARTAVASARQLPLTTAQAARLLLVEGIIAGAARRDAEAARLFEQATPSLAGPRRAVALYGGYFSRALADPARQEAPPSPANGGVGGALAEAFTQSFLQDVPAAIRILRAAESRFPNDPTLPAVRGQFAVLLDDRAQAQEAVDRALALDPADPSALEVRSLIRANRYDLEGALADIERARSAAPGSASVLSNLADIQSARDALREADAAYRRAIELDPADPVTRANYAIFLLNEDRVAEAKVQIDRAIAADPTLDAVLTARGRYRLQTGAFDSAIQDLLASSTANPAYAQGLLALAAGYYESGDRVGAAQALDNADRLDPNDPDVATIRTAIAIEDYDSDGAIAAAQEALRRAQARGGDFAGLNASREQGSILNEAFRLQGLDAWGRYYSEATFDPFNSAAFADRSVVGSPNPFVTSLGFGGTAVDPTGNNNSFPALIQGILLDPGLVASRQGTANLVHRPFLEGSVGGGFVAPAEGDGGWNAAAEARAFASAPFPISFTAAVGGLNLEEERDGGRSQGAPGGPIESDSTFRLGDDDASAVGFLAFRPTPSDTVLAYVNYGRDGNDLTDGRLDFDPGLRDPEEPRLSREVLDFDFDTNDTSYSAGVAVAHTFGYRNVVNVGVFAAGYDRSSTQDLVLGYGIPGIPGPVIAEAVSEGGGEFEQKVLIGAVSHTLGVGDLTLRYGAEGGRVSQDSRQETAIDFRFPTLAPNASLAESRLRFDAARVYLDALYEASPRLTVEGGLFGTLFHPVETTTAQTTAGATVQVDDEGEDIRRLEPRLGLSWEALPGQALRVGFLRESSAFSVASLAPAGVAGLQSNQLPLAVYAQADTYAARWDAEWSPRFFTSLDFQHQEFGNLNIPVPGGLTTADIVEGEIDRVSATANLHLDGGWGLFATVAHASSSGSADGTESDLPFVPEFSGRAGVTVVSTENVRLTVAESYVGKRTGALEDPRSTPFFTPEAEDLASYFTTDASLTWEPLDKRFTLELAGYNLFDEDFEVASNRPGWGRTITGSLRVRF